MPSMLKITDQTTHSITINVTHGKGKVQFLEVVQHHAVYDCFNASQYRYSLAVIQNLAPGMVYSTLGVAAVSHGLHSSVLSIPDHPTNPNPPKGVNRKTQSSTSISLIIEHGTGGIGGFYIFVDGVFYFWFEAVNGTKTNVVVRNLLPGSTHEFRIMSESNDLNSTKSITKTYPTKPSIPVTSYVNSSTDILTILINKGIGGVSSYEIYVNDNDPITETLKSLSQLVFITDLKPGTVYSVYVLSLANDLKSNLSKIIVNATFPDVPVISCLNKTTKTMEILVEKGSGGVERYEILVNGKLHQTFSYETERQNVVIQTLIPGTNYRITANAIFQNLSGKTSTVTQQATFPDVPVISCLNKTTKTMEILVEKGSGGVERYEILVNDKLHKTISYETERQNVVIQKLIPGTHYRITANAVFQNLSSKTSTVTQEATYPCPPKILQVIERTNTTIILKIEPGDGLVDSFHVLVNGSFHSKVGFDSSKTSMTVSSLEAGTLYDFRVKATSNNLTSASSPVVINATYPSPPSSVRIKETKKDSVTIEIIKGEGRVKRFVVSVNGREINVPASLNKDVTIYTISGLDSATKYPIKVSAVSNGAYNTELASIQMSLTTKKDPIPVAIGCVFGGCAALVVVLIVVFSWRRQALCFKKIIRKEVEQGNMNAGFEEEVELEDNRRKRPIKVAEFHRHVEMMSGNSNMGFSQEFKELGILSPKHSTEVSQIQENRPKNRYTNILPFDHSRVKLIGIEDETGSDFINANYIPGKKSKREFIATQGPLPSTKEEMWRMIWEQNVSSVVMLTQLIERGRKKCEIYWPENTNEKMFLGDIIVEVETLSHLSDYTLRTIALRLGDVERRIKHYNYLSWPDMGTPKTSSNMINFVDTVRKEIQPNMNGPIIVHCSAGVGRTGTFIVMDILMQEIRSKCTHVDIFGTILNMRNYRLNMVQTEDQYVFIHKCVKDLIDVSDDEEEDIIEEENAYLNEPIYQNVNK
ncbi:receptor-type tyrosine-protein phosphatase beta [Mytilus galloprovincialis]|uniref:protein-tyrosine-phosphatase n=1 Tax=Mytilus galloprovincialis TaxID=29158 RepID=A0A8B6ER51_MYTGA|nr:receptor-type tyrosine-protein phosphatase beta [Mytilus galloprovincialis]